MFFSGGLNGVMIGIAALVFVVGSEVQAPDAAPDWVTYGSLLPLGLSFTIIFPTLFSPPVRRWCAPGRADPPPILFPPHDMAVRMRTLLNLASRGHPCRDSEESRLCRRENVS